MPVGAIEAGAAIAAGGPGFKAFPQTPQPLQYCLKTASGVISIELDREWVATVEIADQTFIRAFSCATSLHRVWHSVCRRWHWPQRAFSLARCSLKAPRTGWRSSRQDQGRDRQAGRQRLEGFAQQRHCQRAHPQRPDTADVRRGHRTHRIGAHAAGRRARPNAAGNYGQTALHAAAYADNVEAAKLLVDKGGNVNVRDTDRDTPLHTACRHGHKKIAEFLIAKGAKVKPKNAAGWTALHLAVLTGDAELVDLLISSGAYVNEENTRGQTACIWRRQLATWTW